MANIRPRKNKNGDIISYEIRVFKGRGENGKQLKPYTMTWKPSPGMTARQIEKEVQRQALMFEEQIKNGYALDNKQTFAQYADYVVSLKERAGVKHSVVYWYKAQLERINAGIGHLKLNEIRPQHLNALYEQLSAKGLRENGRKARCKVDLTKMLKTAKRTKAEFSGAVGISEGSLRSCCKGNFISIATAEKIAKELKSPVKALFDIVEDTAPLSQSTISGYHRCISAILGQAEKEMLIPYNPAAKATPPKKEKPQPNYFQPADIENIRKALENEPIKWQMIVHLLLITGARRGEIAGLKWSAVDWDNNRIHINVTLLNRTDIGIYEETPKTEQSDRYITLPAETMSLLRKYQSYWLNFRKLCGSAWNSFVQISDRNGNPQSVRADYLFFQESGTKVGYPIRPDSITKWCGDFSRRNGLPHINPHAFRHTMASILYFNGVDSISISGRLGHSKASTTSDIYSHIIKEADKRSAECIADVVLRNKQA
ncbi:MAG: site-specific integrase [Oscillospiraceae bacterium]|nr:site-specific integrase [Oscillospiraceae bacterium]